MITTKQPLALLIHCRVMNLTQAVFIAALLYCSKLQYNSPAFIAVNDKHQVVLVFVFCLTDLHNA